MSYTVDVLETELSKVQKELVRKAGGLSEKVKDLKSVLDALASDSDSDEPLSEDSAKLVSDLGELGQLLTKRDELVSGLSLVNKTKKAVAAGVQRTSGPRQTSEEVQAEKDAVLAIIKDADGPISSSDIKAKLPEDSPIVGKLAQRIGALKDDGVIVQEGEKRGAKYTPAS